MASVMEKLKSTFAKVRQATNAALSDLDSIRDQIAKLSEERAATEHSPRPRTETEAAIRQQIGVLATAFAPPFGNLAQRGASLAAYAPEFKMAAERTPLAFAAAIAPEHLFALASRGLNEIYAANDGMTDSERAAALAKLDEQLLALELAEESAIRSMEAAGIGVLRRANANPMVVLADDSEMPS